MKKLYWIETENTEPYLNLAMEEHLTLHGPKEACLLFLWQNRHTVVIGRNQNCWRECRVEALEHEGGFLARRLSGGGAVFHDLGNLNFSFIADRQDYQVDRQLDVILEAARMAGIRAEKTGRNDITAEGRKFSGNAFYKTEGRCCHHGTLMIDTDSEAVSRYLTVPAKKLASKGVASVKSRVVNLREFCPGLSVERMKRYLIAALEQVYRMPAEKLVWDASAEEILKSRERFASWEWKYGRRIPFSREAEGRFAWGGIWIQLQVNEGRVARARVYSDALEQNLARSLEEAFAGAPYGSQGLADCVERAAASWEEAAGKERMKEDIKGLVRQALA